jgi:hypothetical protein
MNLMLHKEKGVNPRLTCCRNCGKDVGVALLGINEGIYECNICKVNHIGYPSGGRCPKCATSVTKTGTVGEHDKLPIELCDDCEAKEKASADAVRDGGIYWKCSKCHSSGAILKRAPLAQMVREQMNIAAPNPCGIDFEGGINCPVCNQ